MKTNDVLCHHLYDSDLDDVHDHDPYVNHDLYDYHDPDHNDDLDFT